MRNTTGVTTGTVEIPSGLTGVDVGVAIDVVVLLSNWLPPRPGTKVSAVAPLNSAIAVIARDFMRISILDCAYGQMWRAYTPRGRN
ncbi:hypothetical protein A5678_11450 [Mycobacterium sp. E2733]|nr:hypothetical protein A5678_11450 [Mycobacterium sp. E2733]